jgi:hypothetical protein
LNHDREIPITEGVLLAAALNAHGGAKSMELLLERNPEVPITELVVLAAAKNVNEAGELMSLLLKKDREIPITESVLEAVVDNSFRGVGVIKELQKYGREIASAKKVVESALYRARKPSILRLMQEQGVEIPITEQTILDTVEYSGFGIFEMISMLQGRRTGHRRNCQSRGGDDAEERGGAEQAMMMMEILIERDKEIVISAEIVQVAAGNKELGFEMMKMLLEGRKTTVADDAVPVIASLFGQQITKLLDTKRTAG